MYEVVKERVRKERAKKELAKKEFVRERVSQRNCSSNVNGIASGAGG